jgi:hypothetical protein
MSVGSAEEENFIFLGRFFLVGKGKLLCLFFLKSKSNVKIKTFSLLNEGEGKQALDAVNKFPPSVKLSTRYNLAHRCRIQRSMYILDFLKTIYSIKKEKENG